MPEATLKINDEYRSLLPHLPPAEYEALKNSLRQNGLYVPITVNPEGFILDGHNRYEICIELGVEPKYEVKTFEDPLLEKKFVIESNLTRRHLTTFQRIEMALPLIELERELAQKRMLRGNPRQKFAEGKTLEIVAQRIGVSHELLRQALYIMEHASEEDLAKIRSGERAISSLYKEVKHSMEKRTENQAKRVSASARALLRLLNPPGKKLLEIGKYKNTKYAIYTVEKPLQEKVERAAEKLKVTTEILVQNIIEEKLREIATLKLEDIEASRHIYLHDS